MKPTLDQLAFAAEYLQREREAHEYAERVSPVRLGDPESIEANDRVYKALLARRYELFVSLPERFDRLTVGWHRAAVRLYGERAAEALDATIAEGLAVGWPGVGDAERALMCAMARREKSTE